MWSDDKPAPHDADGVADDLHAALAAAGEQAPFVLVGHSLGGPYIMDYTRKFPDQVAGLVFVDSSHPDQIEAFRKAKIPGSDKSALPAYVGVIAKLSWTGVPRLILNQSPGESNVPPSTAAEMKAYAPIGFPAAIAEGQSIPVTLSEAGRLRTLGDRPIVVLTSTETAPAAMLKMAGMTAADYDRLNTVKIGLHNDMASWSTRSRHQLVPDALHYIQFDRPDVVIAAVKEVVGEVREGPQKPQRVAAR
jgi:pimeloyl-ACP methyl ester carboxylesterase